MSQEHISWWDSRHQQWAGRYFWAAPLRPLLLLTSRCGGSCEAKCKPQLVSDLVSSEEGWSENKVTVSKALKELWGFFIDIRFYSSEEVISILSVSNVR